MKEMLMISKKDMLIKNEYMDSEIDGFFKMLMSDDEMRGGVVFLVVDTFIFIYAFFLTYHYIDCLSFRR